ncbi:MAG: hypothetical protein LQ346_008727 [Caloplaca aetnensis]|nr:MAG: hypothetical protein LQ346_008727 [Caloplaca aetnensis]
MCPFLAPGMCCSVPPDPVFDDQYPKKRVVMLGLGPYDVASAFSAEPPNTGCNGRSLASWQGPGDWEYEVPAGQDYNITGACYMKLPPGLPTEEEKSWLQYEGALAFSAGNAQWVNPALRNPSAQSAALSWLSGGAVPMSPKVKRFGKRVVDMARMNIGRGLGKRGIMSATKGRILFKGPSKTTWADTIELDGVRYTAETPQSQVFVSADGKVLNYTQPAS